VTAEQREQVSALFEAALDRESDQRDAFLDDACDNEEIRAEVKSLLAEHDSAGTFMTNRCLNLWDRRRQDPL